MQGAHLNAAKSIIINKDAFFFFLNFFGSVHSYAAEKISSGNEGLLIKRQIKSIHVSGHPRQQNNVLFLLLAAAVALVLAHCPLSDEFEMIVELEDEFHVAFLAAAAAAAAAAATAILSFPFWAAALWHYPITTVQILFVAWTLPIGELLRRIIYVQALVVIVRHCRFGSRSLQRLEHVLGVECQGFREKRRFYSQSIVQIPVLRHQSVAAVAAVFYFFWDVFDLDSIFHMIEFDEPEYKSASEIIIISIDSIRSKN